MGFHTTAKALLTDNVLKQLNRKHIVISSTVLLLLFSSLLTMSLIDRAGVLFTAAVLEVLVLVGRSSSFQFYAVHVQPVQRETLVAGQGKYSFYTCNNRCQALMHFITACHFITREATHHRSREKDSNQSSRYACTFTSQPRQPVADFYGTISPHLGLWSQLIWIYFPWTYFKVSVSPWSMAMLTLTHFVRPIALSSETCHCTLTGFFNTTTLQRTV